MLCQHTRPHPGALYTCDGARGPRLLHPCQPLLHRCHSTTAAQHSRHAALPAKTAPSSHAATNWACVVQTHVQHALGPTRATWHASKPACHPHTPPHSSQRASQVCSKQQQPPHPNRHHRLAGGLHPNARDGDAFNDFKYIRCPLSHAQLHTPTAGLQCLPVRPHIPWLADPAAPPLPRPLSTNLAPPRLCTVHTGTRGAHLRGTRNTRPAAARARRSHRRGRCRALHAAADVAAAAGRGRHGAGLSVHCCQHRGRHLSRPLRGDGAPVSPERHLNAEPWLSRRVRCLHDDVVCLPLFVWSNRQAATAAASHSTL